MIQKTVQYKFDEKKMVRMTQELIHRLDIYFRLNC